VSTLLKYNLNGEQVGEVAIEASFLDVEANPQMIKDYIVAIRANKRQWSACTKTRSEVKHTTRKPHKQKGTGGARQGSTVSPQYRGGGIVFGPKPKFDQHVRINKKERRLAIHFLLAEKIRNGSLLVLESTDMDAPKTKAIADFMTKIEAEKRVLFLVDANLQVLAFDLNDEGSQFQYRFSAPTMKHENFQKSIRNIQRAQYSLAVDVNGYNLMLANKVIITEEGLKQLIDQLQRR
jgi:large subunit ribosomal protein L4